MTWRARYNLSKQFITGLEQISKSIQSNDELNNVFTLQQKNLASILFSVNCVEAKINEFLSTIEFDMRNPMSKRIKAITEIEKRISMVEKYNLVWSLINESNWDSSREPYQSYDEILFLRNEIVHYKGKYEELGACPKRLMNLLQKVNSDFSDGKVWIDSILKSEGLSTWILSVTKKILKIIEMKMMIISENKSASGNTA